MEDQRVNSWIIEFKLSAVASLKVTYSKLGSLLLDPPAGRQDCKDLDAKVTFTKEEVHNQRTS